MPGWDLAFGGKSTAEDVLAGVDLSDRTAIVTGANTGIGYETARALATAGARVIFACRDRERGLEAVERCLSADPKAKAELGLVDLGSLASVRAFVEGLDLPRLDILVCNAGIYGGGYNETADGFERCVGICHVGHFLLFSLLQSALERASDARVVMVSSESHRTPRRLDFGRLPLTGGNYSDLVAYGQAKLCNVLMAAEIERRFGDRGVHGYALHPGTLVTTGIGRNSMAARVLVMLTSPFTKSASQGAATSVMCAARPELAAHGGQYFSDCRPRRPSQEASQPEIAQRLWELSEGWASAPSGRDQAGG